MARNSRNSFYTKVHRTKCIFSFVFQFVPQMQLTSTLDAVVYDRAKYRTYWPNLVLDSHFVYIQYTKIQ